MGKCAIGSEFACLHSPVRSTLVGGARDGKQADSHEVSLESQLRSRKGFDEDKFPPPLFPKMSVLDNKGCRSYEVDGEKVRLREG